MKWGLGWNEEMKKRSQVVFTQFLECLTGVEGHGYVGESEILFSEYNLLKNASSFIDLMFSDLHKLKLNFGIFNLR